MLCLPFILALKKGKCCAFFAHFLALPHGPYIAILVPGALGPTTAQARPHGPWAPSVQIGRPVGHAFLPAFGRFSILEHFGVELGVGELVDGCFDAGP